MVEAIVRRGCGGDPTVPREREVEVTVHREHIGVPVRVHLEVGQGMLKTVFDAEDAALVEMARKAIDAGDFVRHTIVALDAWVAV